MAKGKARDRFDDEAERYLERPYTRMLVPDPEDGGFVAEVLELPGCLSQGDTPEEAYANLEEAMAGWIAVSLEAGHAIPEPIGASEYSGRFALRISSELHRQAALRAMREGISLNQWIALAMAEKVSGEREAGAPAQYEVSRRGRKAQRVADRG